MAARIAGSKASMSGNFLKPGNYLLEVQKMLEKADARKGAAFISEFIVLEATKTDETVTPNAVGSQASYVVNLTQDSGPGNVKAFLMVLLDVPEDQVTAESISEALSDQQPFRFFRVKDSAFQKPQRQDPSKMFTYHRWEKFEADYTDEGLLAISARRKAANAAEAAEKAAKPAAG
jgi:hypothetical protein